MTFFENAIRELDQMGVAQVILPFILIFAIVYAILMKIQIFKSVQNEKGINSAIAFVLALVPVFQHFRNPGSAFDIIPHMNNILADVSIIFIAVLLLLILIGIWGIGPKNDENKLQGAVVIIAVAIIAIIVASEFGFGWYDISRYLDRSTVTIVAALLIFGLIIKFITDDGKPKKGDTLEDIGGMFEKKG